MNRIQQPRRRRPRPRRRGLQGRQRSGDEVDLAAVKGGSNGCTRSARGKPARWWWNRRKREHDNTFDDDNLRAKSSEQPPKCCKETGTTPSPKKIATEHLGAFNNDKLASTRRGARASEQLPRRGNRVATTPGSRSSPRRSQSRGGARSWMI
jgi:hypothetical protein